MAEIRPSKPFIQRLTTVSKWLVPYYRTDVAEFMGNQVNATFAAVLSDYPLVRIKKVELLLLHDNNVRACNFPFYGFVTFKGTAIHGKKFLYLSSCLNNQTFVDCDILLSPEKLDELEVQIQLDNRVGDQFITLADDLVPVPEISVYIQIHGEYVDI